jgi:predicted methyltransferase
MRVFFAGALAALALGACAGGAVPGLTMSAESVNAGSPHIAAALADPRRPEADTTRDVLRHPGDVLAFMQVLPGQRVADVGPGGGYYTRLLAVAVGETGRVYAVDRAGTAERPRPMSAVAPLYPNITHLQAGYQGWSAGEPLDAILIVQIYHDFHLPQLNLDVPQINRDLFAALKPGGVLIVADHSAPDGSDVAVANTLHRIDQAQVRRELEAAGFVMEAESQVLRNPEDNRSLRVFEGDIRGHTDQFVMRFRKPAA